MKAAGNVFHIFVSQVTCVFSAVFLVYKLKCWLATSCCRKEDTFGKFYPDEYLACLDLNSGLEGAKPVDVPF